MTDKLLLALLILALGAGGGWYFTRDHYTGRIAKLERDRITAIAQAEAEARAEESRRTEAVRKEAENAREKIAVLETDLRDADAAARGLRDAIAGQRRAAEGAAVASGGEAACTTGGVPADLFLAADEFAAAVAGYADRARIAGEACERAYGALRN